MTKERTVKILDVFYPIVEGKYDDCDVHIYYGSRKGAKSHFVFQNEIKDCINDEYYKCIVTRKVAKTISESVYESLKETISDMGLDSEFDIKKSPMKITHISTGNKFLFYGLDEPRKLKSVRNPSRVIFEEAEEISEEDYNTVALTLRSDKVDVLRKVLIFNPPEYSGFWVFDRFFLNPEQYERADGLHTFMPSKQKGVMILHTCHKHNQTLKAHDLKDFEDIQRLVDSAQTKQQERYYQDMYNRVALGLITNSKTGDEYVKTFSKSVHVAPVSYNEELAIHFTMDFNVNPYMSGLCVQFENVVGSWLNYTEWTEVRVFKEYSLESPDNSAGAMGEHFSVDFHDHLIEHGGFFLYGDASGNNRIPIKQVKNLFHDFEKNILEGVRIEKRVPKSNPKYKAILGKGTLGRRSHTNNMYGGAYPVRMIIDPSCINLIDDLRLCQEDGNGKLLKKVKNGVEERSHHLQALEYFYCHMKTFGYLSQIKK